MKKLPPYVRLERLLEVLSEEIAVATDAEILAACAELKMKPEMKGSMAFLGLRSPYFPYRHWVFSSESPASTDPTARPGARPESRPRRR
jgi:hypothetical protein